MVRNSADRNDVQELAALIQDIRVAMLTTVQSDGTMHSRPMATQRTPFDGELWFFTDLASAKVHEIQADQRVLLSYADPDRNTYLSVCGRANVIRDPVKAKALWNPLLKAWFPNGLSDPNVALLRVTVDSAEYWKSAPSTVVQLVGFAKALATGQRYDAGTNRKIDLHPTTPPTERS